MGIYQCERCSKCGSDLAEGPSSHRDPKPHRMLAAKVEAKTDSGIHNVGTLTSCVWCQKSLSEIEQVNEPWEHWPKPEQIYFIDGKEYHIPENIEYICAATARAQLGTRSGYTLHFDEPGKPLGAPLQDSHRIGWGSRLVAVPHAHC